MICMNNLKAELDVYRQRTLEVMSRVLDSGNFILGKEVSEFEQIWGQQCDAQFCIGTGNGMDALEIGMRALGIGEGDEVITTSMTAFATALSIMRTGAKPVFADIAPDTALLDPGSVNCLINKKTKAILAVHLYGLSCDLDVLLKLANFNGLHLIEDCAQSHLGKYNNLSVGSYGVFGAWSFYPTKNLGACGDAGAITTNSESLAKIARALRNYGQTNRYEHSFAGVNSRMDEMQAAILKEKLNWLSDFTEKRRNIAKAYKNGISNKLITLMKSPIDDSSHVYHLFAIKCDLREELQKYLENNQIDTLIHYPIPAHLQKPCLNNGDKNIKLTYCEEHAKKCLSIPCHPQMKMTEIENVISVINKFKG
jgi:dTDP-4-amino-4,6-dideoxygalactose transaminase